MVVLDI